MLKTNRVLWAFALVAAGVVAVGCGGDDSPSSDVGQGGHSSTTTTTTTTTTTSDTGGAGGGYVCPPGSGTTLALTKLTFGVGTSGQWKKVGLDLDGLVSTAASTDVCQLSSDASPSTPYPDGDNGIDNSFGKNLLPLIIALRPTWQDEVNNLLEVGQFNAMLKMYCLPPTGDAELTTKLFGGTTLATIPKYDGTDMWPVAPELLSDLTDPESSTITFAKSTVKGNTFDSGKNQIVILTVPWTYMDNSTTIKLTLYGAQMTMTLADDRKSATAGTIGGVLNTEEFIDQVKKIGWMANLCNEPTFPDLLKQVRQASDIMSDGSQDPAQTCDAISIGIAFEMKEVQIGDVGPPAEVGMACP